MLRQGLMDGNIAKTGINGRKHDKVLKLHNVPRIKNPRFRTSEIYRKDKTYISQLFITEGVPSQTYGN